MRYSTFLFLFCMAGFTSMQAQDLHFSQFHLHPQYANPANTGIFIGDMRYSGIYRSQWTTVPVNYQTFGGAFDMKAMRRGGFMLSGGLQLHNDQAGDAALTWTHLGLSASVAHALTETQSLSIGFGAGIAQRKFDISKLRFKNQWTGEVFDSSLPTKEAFGQSSGFQPTFSVGLNWHLQTNEEGRTMMDIGVAAAHINRPTISFNGDKTAKLPIHLSLNAKASVPVFSALDGIAIGSLQKMADNRELLVGLGVRQWLSNLPGKRTALQFILATRFNDALIPMLQLEQNSWTFGVSYDWNTSDFEVATNGRGGVELAAIYRLVKVPPVKALKACPIF